PRRAHRWIGSDRRSHIGPPCGDGWICTTRLLTVARRLDVAIARALDARGSAATPTAARRCRGPTTCGTAAICVGPPARPPILGWTAVGVIAVMANAAPIPASPVVPVAPAIADPRVVVIPGDDQRRWRTPVVAPRTPVGVPKDE